MNYWRISTIVAFGLLAALGLHVWIGEHQPTPTGWTVLACTNAKGELEATGISHEVRVNDNYYSVLDGEGNWQTYRPGAFETCATLSLEDARKKGLIK